MSSYSFDCEDGCSAVSLLDGIITICIPTLYRQNSRKCRIITIMSPPASSIVHATSKLRILAQGLLKPIHD